MVKEDWIIPKSWHNSIVTIFLKWTFWNEMKEEETFRFHELNNHEPNSIKNIGAKVLCAKPAKVVYLLIT